MSITGSFLERGQVKGQVAGTCCCCGGTTINQMWKPRRNAHRPQPLSGWRAVVKCGMTMFPTAGNADHCKEPCGKSVKKDTASYSGNGNKQTSNQKSYTPLQAFWCSTILAKSNASGASLTHVARLAWSKRTARSSVKIIFEFFMLMPVTSVLHPLNEDQGKSKYPDQHKMCNHADQTVWRLCFTGIKHPSDSQWVSSFHHVGQWAFPNICRWTKRYKLNFVQNLASHLNDAVTSVLFVTHINAMLW